MGQVIFETDRVLKVVIGVAGSDEDHGPAGQLLHHNLAVTGRVDELGLPDRVAGTGIDRPNLVAAQRRVDDPLDDRYAHQVAERSGDGRAPALGAVIRERRDRT